MLSFKDYLIERKEKSIVFAFGRFNPITIGHEKVIEFLKTTAKGSEAVLYLSQTQDKKKNPLSFTEKIKFAKKAFKGIKISTDKTIKTPFDVFIKLSEAGYKNVKIITGEDRIDEFQKMVKPYLNNPKKTPNLLFTSFKVISAGNRDPDEEGVEGASASKMRKFASEGNLKKFISGTPSGLSDRDSISLFKAVRKGMEIK